MQKKVVAKIILYVSVIVIFSWCVFPFYWAFTSSIKPDSDLFKKNPSLIPKRVTFINYVKVFSDRPFHVNIMNSAIVALATTGFSLLIGVMAGYAIARLKFPMKALVMSLILAVSMFPQVSILGSFFLILRSLHLISTYPGLILPYITLNLPLAVWILQNFFRELPIEIEEASLIDGCSRFRLLWSIVVPISSPGIVATGLLIFINSWNEFLFALTFMQKPRMYTIPVAVALFRGASQYEIPWGQLMSAAVIVTLPLVILVFVFQNKIIEGLSAGAVKG